MSLKGPEFAADRTGGEKVGQRNAPSDRIGEEALLGEKITFMKGGLIDLTNGETKKENFVNRNLKTQAIQIYNVGGKGEEKKW